MKEEKVIALAGNPNVGKSTVFNGLTGMNQHTGNWPGKTVDTACGQYSSEKGSYILIDLPGTYSLMAHSAEEEVARNYICFSRPDAVVVVCDATCLERNMNLVLQITEITEKVIVCVNLLDEAKRKGIRLDLKKLEEKSGIPFVGITAHKKSTLKNLTDRLDTVIQSGFPFSPLKIRYPQPVEDAAAVIEKVMQNYPCITNTRWLSLKLLDSDSSLIEEISKKYGRDFMIKPEINAAVEAACKLLAESGIDNSTLKDITVSAIIENAAQICSDAIVYENDDYNESDRCLDRIFTGRTTGYPVMLCLLAVIFWITVTGANYPSELLSGAFLWIQEKLTGLFNCMNAPDWLHDSLILGVYRMLAWVVSVMLPPMAIFFPLFTLLEDAGYLPRIAYNLDSAFQKCSACGKQALTMCMGFGCNAVGIIGCRIIDSPRERLLAILTNNFVPCNGRFPTLIALISMFFIMPDSDFLSSLLSAVILTCVILAGITVTFATTKLLSKTLLKGVPASFTLELPPYRRPQFVRVIVRSIFDKTLFVLGRAVMVATPAGLVIWMSANITVGDISILNHCAAFLDPFARLMGLDGIILMAFILGFPANETVIPIIIMAYMSQGCLTETETLMEMKQLFLDNGWNMLTAVCTILFSLMHWPCSTTLLTIKKETASMKWTLLAAAIPTCTGIAVCMLTASVYRLFI